MYSLNVQIRIQQQNEKHLDTAGYKVSTHNPSTYLAKKTKPLIKASSQLQEEIKPRVTPRKKPTTKKQRICTRDGTANQKIVFDQLPATSTKRHIS